MPNILKSKWFWVAAVLVAPLLATGFFWYTGTAQLEAQFDALRAQGLPVTSADLDDFYSIPLNADDTTELWVAAITAVEAAEVGKRGRDLPFVGENGSEAVPPPGQEWPDLKASRAFLAELQPELDAIYAAAEAGGQARYRIDFSAGFNTPLPHLQEARNVARLLTLDAHVAAHSGEYARAHRDCLAIFRLAESLRNEPTLISQLVRMAIFAVGCDVTLELMPHCDWSDAELARLQATIVSITFREPTQAAFQGQRALALTTLNTTVPAALRNANALETLRMFETVISALDGPWQDALQQSREVNARVAALGSSSLSRIKYMGVMLHAPAFEQAVVAAVRNEARRRCMVAAVASGRYRLEHGNWPASLSEIEERDLGTAEQKSLLTDPLAEALLRYRVDGDRILIYSVGTDRTDDGGDFTTTGGSPPRDFGIAIRRPPLTSPHPAGAPEN